MADWIAPEQPDAETFGIVTYCAPSWAFKDRSGETHATARVSYPGKLTFPPDNAHGMYNAPPVDGTDYEPLDSFCDLETEGELGMAYAIQLHTFGRLVEKVAKSGAVVRVGDPLFRFEARPPTTEEWVEQREETHKMTGKFLDLWFVLKASPMKIIQWRYEQRGKVPRDYERR